ncbi:MAG: TrbI/VirB10 family protein [Candidatus Omnitrophica bacterium]|nr:TrbI/VirB10 family protein [Candidatus Omnitrophota bacterium]
MDDSSQKSSKISFQILPRGIVSYGKLPLIIFFIAFAGLMLYLIFSSEHQKKSGGLKTAGKTVSAKNVEVKQLDKQSWFKDAQINKNKLAENLHKDRRADKVAVKILSEQEIKLRKAVREEEFATKVKIQKMREQAVADFESTTAAAAKSPMTIDIKKPRDFQPSQKLTAVGSKILNDVKDQVTDNRQENFLKGSGEIGEYLPYLKQKPLSEYELKAGAVIPIAMITGINSDLPGDITALVTENVYDTVTGQYLLIPQGCRLVGTYDSQLSYGQNRVLVVWLRLQFPNGSTINLDRMQGVDVSGYAGLKDKANNHYLRIYGSALLMSMVGTSYAILEPRRKNGSVSDDAAGKVGQQLGDVFTQQTQKNLDIRPTVEIRPGTKSKVMVMKDMILEPYEI